MIFGENIVTKPINLEKLKVDNLFGHLYEKFKNRRNWHKGQISPFCVYLFEDVWEKTIEASLDFYKDTGAEVSGIILGKYLYDDYGEFSVGILYQQGEGKHNTKVHCELTVEDNKRIYKISKEKNLLQIVWYHTHPNFAVFYSNVDRYTLSTRYNSTFQSGIVANFKDEYKAYKAEDKQIFDITYKIFLVDFDQTTNEITKFQNPYGNSLLASEIKQSTNIHFDQHKRHTGLSVVNTPIFEDSKELEPKKVIFEGSQVVSTHLNDPQVTAENPSNTKLEEQVLPKEEPLIKLSEQNPSTKDKKGKVIDFPTQHTQKDIAAQPSEQLLENGGKSSSRENMIDANNRPYTNTIDNLNTSTKNDVNSLNSNIERQNQNSSISHNSNHQLFKLGSTRLVLISFFGLIILFSVFKIFSLNNRVKSLEDERNLPIRSSVLEEETVESSITDEKLVSNTHKSSEKSPESKKSNEDGEDKNISNSITNAKLQINVFSSNGVFMHINVDDKLNCSQIYNKGEYLDFDFEKFVTIRSFNLGYEILVNGQNRKDQVPREANKNNEFSFQVTNKGKEVVIEPIQN